MCEHGQSSRCLAIFAGYIVVRVSAQFLVRTLGSVPLRDGVGQVAELLVEGGEVRAQVRRRRAGLVAGAVCSAMTSMIARSTISGIGGRGPECDLGSGAIPWPATGAGRIITGSWPTADPGLATLADLLEPRPAAERRAHEQSRVEPFRELAGRAGKRMRLVSKGAPDAFAGAQHTN